MDNIKNHRYIKVKYISPTNRTCSRIKIYEPKRWKDETAHSKTFSYDYSIGSTREQAQKILIRNGFKVKGYASEVDDKYSFFCDNWGEDFLSIKDLK